MVKDLIKDLDLSKILWRIICVLIILFAFNIKIVNLSWEQAEKILDYKRDHYTKELNEYELDDFIRIYPKYKQDKIFQRVDTDYIMEYPDSTDWITKRWFIYQAWDIGRFFYIQKRVQQALNLIKIRKEAAGFAEQLENREDEIAKQMFELQKSKAENTEDFSEDELNLVERKSEALNKIFGNKT